MVRSEVLERRLTQLAIRTSCEFEIQSRGYVPTKGERIVKCLKNPAIGLMTDEEWRRKLPELVEFVEKHTNYIDRKAGMYKLVYKTATVQGGSRLYIIKR